MGRVVSKHLTSSQAQKLDPLKFVYKMHRTEGLRTPRSTEMSTCASRIVLYLFYFGSPVTRLEQLHGPHERGSSHVAVELPHLEIWGFVYFLRMMHEPHIKNRRRKRLIELLVVIWTSNQQGYAFSYSSNVSICRMSLK